MTGAEGDERSFFTILYYKYADFGIEAPRPPGEFGSREPSKKEQPEPSEFHGPRCSVGEDGFLKVVYPCSNESLENLDLQRR